MAELKLEDRGRLVSILSESKDRGFLGPGPVEPHIDHALRFALGDYPAPERVLDLGSGGGIPGLVLALLWSESRFTLLDSMEKRCAFLRQATVELDIHDRVDVYEGRAELAGRDGAHRRSYDVVTARSFAAPGVTAECAAGLLKLAGVLVVSEPPDSGSRWPADGLEKLGMQLQGPTTGVVIIRQVAECDDRFPRRVGIPTKRPLF